MESRRKKTRNPFKYLSVARDVRNYARKAANSSNIPRKTNGKQDAYRHCITTGELSRRTNPKVAKIGGRIHEARTPNHKNERGMDLYNNSVGADVGKTAKSFNDVQKGCENALSKGKLQT